MREEASVVARHAAKPRAEGENQQELDEVVEQQAEEAVDVTLDEEGVGRGRGHVGQTKRDFNRQERGAEGGTTRTRRHQEDTEQQSGLADDVDSAAVDGEVAEGEEAGGVRDEEQGGTADGGEAVHEEEGVGHREAVCREIGAKR